jgi:hypothetical protein
MYSNTPRDLALTLGDMQRAALERSQYDQTAAKGMFREYLQHDRRFDQYDADRLIDRVQEARSCGRTLDLDDPYLMRGGSKRPLSF